ncbi:META domain-containing protein [Afipia sp. TerB]
MLPKAFLAALVVGMLALPAGANAAPPHGSWLAEDINGGGVIDRLQTTLQLGADGKVTGTGGCNRYMGRAILKGDAITFGPMAGTRMACPPAVMDQENKFHAALETVRSWRIEQGRLLLLDSSGNVALRFSTMDKHK